MPENVKSDPEIPEIFICKCSVGLFQCFMILHLETSLSEWAESFPHTHFGQFDCSLLLLSFPIDVEFSFPLVIRILNQTFSSSVMTFIHSIWSFLLPASLVSSRGKISFNISQPFLSSLSLFCWEIRRNLWQLLRFPTFTFYYIPNNPSCERNRLQCCTSYFFHTFLATKGLFFFFSAWHWSFRHLDTFEMLWDGIWKEKSLRVLLNVLCQCKNIYCQSCYLK